MTAWCMMILSSSLPWAQTEDGEKVQAALSTQAAAAAVRSPSGLAHSLNTAIQEVGFGSFFILFDLCVHILFFFSGHTTSELFLDRAPFSFLFAGHIIFHFPVNNDARRAFDTRKLKSQSPTYAISLFYLAYHH